MSFTHHKSNTLPVKSRLAHKLHPYRHPGMSGLLVAIVGFVVGVPFGNPRIVEMAVTPDRFILARPEGEVSAIPVGHYNDLLPAWYALLASARLTPTERQEAEALFAAKIGYLGRATA